MEEYDKKVIRRFLKPKFSGEIKNPSAVGQVGNAACGDIMRIFLKIQKNKKGKGKIKDIKFKTMGCVAAIASSDALCEVAKGKTIEDAKKINKNDILKVVGKLPAIKYHCSLLGEEALQNAISNYENNSPPVKMPYKSKQYYLTSNNNNSKTFQDGEKLKELKTLAATQKYSVNNLSKKFNCGRGAIFYALYNQKIIIPNLGKFKKSTSCNDDFFDKIDPTSAYWAGFIAADGNLFAKDKSLSIGLALRDLNHLEKFKRAVGSNAKISIILSNNSARITIRSHNIFEALYNRGIRPNKSLTIQSVNIPEKLIAPFLRGVYDGDGSISGSDRKHLQLCIVGNKPFLIWIQNFLVKKIDLNKTKIYSLSRCKARRLQYTGIQSLKILDFIYKNSTSKTRLQRKYEKYLYLKNKYPYKLQ